MANLKVMTSCYGGNAQYAEALRPIINNLGMTLTTIHEHPNANIKWELGTWYGYLNQADIIIVAANYKGQPEKSANRVTQAMSMGKAIVCSPLPSYIEVAKMHPGCFFIAETTEEWEEKLRILRDNPTLREQMGKKAQEAAKDYSIDAMGEKWLKMLKGDNASVDIVIPTYKNLRGIKLCLDSIRACTDTPYKIIVINNGNSEELHEYLSKQNILYIRKEKLNFAQAVNIGIQAGTNKYVCILNDDIIVSKGWLKELLNACDSGVGCVGPLSNCDKGWLHNFNINIGGVELLPGMNTFEQIEPIVSQIYDYKSPYQDKPNRDWVAYYCNLIPREVFNKVGLLDEVFTNSGEDTDHCNRIRRMGYKILQTYKSFVFHFGAVSRRALEQEDQALYQENDRKTNLYLNLKYSKPLVVIYSGPSWERWSYKSVDEGGIGGSETWQVCLARSLSELGYRVINFADCPESEMWDGQVQYQHYTNYPTFIAQNHINFLISSRTTDSILLPVRADRIYTQIHDVFYLSLKTQTCLNKITKHCVLSEWHRNFVSDYHNIPKSKIALMSNGLDMMRYEGKVEKHPYRMFWSSSLDRGIDTLLYLFDFIKAEIPGLELHVFYGFNTWQAAAKQRGNAEELKKIEIIQAGLKKPGVFYHGRVGQRELAIEQMKSSLWAYPTDFEETFSITAIEAQAAGCPVIASNYAGLQTTIGDSGILIGNGTKGQSYTKEYREEFVGACIRLLKSQEEWKYWSEKGKENALKYSWEKCALKWKKLFEE